MDTFIHQDLSQMREPIVLNKRTIAAFFRRSSASLSRATSTQQHHHNDNDNDDRRHSQTHPQPPRFRRRGGSAPASGAATPPLRPRETLDVAVATATAPPPAITAATIAHAAASMPPPPSAAPPHDARVRNYRADDDCLTLNELAIMFPRAQYGSLAWAPGNARAMQQPRCGEEACHHEQQQHTHASRVDSARPGCGDGDDDTQAMALAGAVGAPHVVPHHPGPAPPRAKPAPHPPHRDSSPNSSSSACSSASCSSPADSCCSIIDNDDDDDACAICLAPFACADAVHVLPCRHLFHAACLAPWFVATRAACPLCRRAYAEDAAKLRALFFDLRMGRC